MFNLTSAAAQQIHQAALASDAQSMALRVAARLDPDGGVQYAMGFDDPDDTDLKLDVDGIAVVIAVNHQELLNETTLDFVELQPGEFNFIFVDSQAADTTVAGGCSTGGCSSGGCGSSKGGCH